MNCVARRNVARTPTSVTVAVSPLAENRALSVGDFVFLSLNDLDLWEGSDDAKDIRALRNRGVTVDHDEIAAGP